MDDNTLRLSHPDFVTTWKESPKGLREGVWLPYLQSIEKIPRSKRWRLAYNGGSIDTDLSKVDTILLYGASGVIPTEFLDALNEQRIVLMVHRRNQPSPYLCVPSLKADTDDLLSKQIVSRLNMHDAAYVSRTLIRERLDSVASLVAMSETTRSKLAATRNVESVRSIEATQTARDWDVYYDTLGLQNVTRRNYGHPVNAALDAGSFFLHGVLLRWTLFHQLSPFHGFLHRPTGYPALIYDLIEPYRVWIEDSVRQAWSEGVVDGNALTARAIDILKAKMEEPVYVPATMQTVRRKSLLHASVLSLRAWLLGTQKRFIVPVEGIRKGGRPVKVGFSIPGYTAQ